MHFSGIVSDGYKSLGDGEAVEFTLERDVSGQFVQDCEVCCRPWRVHAWWDEDGRLHVTVDRDG